MSLDTLAAEAANLTPPPADGAPPPPGEAQPAPPPSVAESNVQALCFILAALREFSAQPLIFNPPLTTFRQHLPDDKLPYLAGPWGPVLENWGVNLGGLDSPLAVALMTTGPALWAMVEDLRDELRARRAKPITPEPEPGQDA